MLLLPSWGTCHVMTQKVYTDKIDFVMLFDLFKTQMVPFTSFQQHKGFQEIQMLH